MASKVALASAAALYKREHRMTAAQLLAETVEHLHNVLAALARKNISEIADPKLHAVVSEAAAFIGYEDEGNQEDEPATVTGL